MSNFNNTLHTGNKLQTPIMGLLMSAIALALAAQSPQKAIADPVPRPPNPAVKLPPVFCFRFTDIKAVEDDPEGDKFRFEFEVLNWTNTPASGVYLALNEGTGASGTVNAAPFLAGGKIDQNGRPIGNLDDSGPIGNQNKPNDWNVSDANSSAIEWEAGTAIPNSNLLGARSTQEACGLVPGCELQGNGQPQYWDGRSWRNLHNSSYWVSRGACRPGWNGWWWGWSNNHRCAPQDPVVADMETVDNGLNVLDGFEFIVDDWDENEIVSLNWFLLDANGNPIGVSGRGNAYGFGTVNLMREPLNEDVDPGALFAGNTGFSESNTLFYNNVNRVTKSVSTPAPPATTFATFSAPVPGGFSTASLATDDNLAALFTAEFGPGTTAGFWNPEDNKFGAPTNTQLVPGFTPIPPSERGRKVPEPSSLGMLLVAVLGLVGTRKLSAS